MRVSSKDPLTRRNVGRPLCTFLAIPHALRRLALAFCALFLLSAASAAWFGINPLASAATGAATWSLEGGPASLGFVEVDTVSCPDATYCVALESSQYATTSLVWSAGTWTTVPISESGGPFQLNSVSCPSETFCMAVGVTAGSAETSVIEEWNGTSWVVVANPDSSSTNSELESVSCPTTSTCYAVGQDGNGGVVEECNGSLWSMAIPQVADDSLASVSCASVTSCVAVGNAATPNLASLVMSNGTWTSVTPPNPGNDAFLYSVSCPQSTLCLAVGSVQDPGVGYGVSLTEEWDGAAWTVVPSPNPATDALGAGSLPAAILIGVSCADANACVAVGYGGGGSGYPGIAVVETWNGAGWSLTSTPAPVVSGGFTDLRGVSCVPSGANAFCAAVGYEELNGGGSQSAVTLETSAAVGSLDPSSIDLGAPSGGQITATVDPDSGSSLSDSGSSLSDSGSSLSRAQLAQTAPEGEPTPTGSLTILSGGLPISSCPPQALGSTGEVTCTIPSGTSGPFTAAYSGDSTFAGSSEPMVTSTVLTSSANPVVTGDPVTYTATVSPAPDGGSVSFSDNGTALPGCASVNITSGTATCQTSYGTTADHNVIATYSGDTSYLESASNSLTESVTSTTIATTSPPSGGSAPSTTSAARPIEPRIVIGSIRAKHGAFLVRLTCERATCNGEVALSSWETVNTTKADHKITRRKALLLATARYTLKAQEASTIRLLLTGEGQRFVADGHTQSPIRATLRATANGGSTATKAVMV